MILHRVPDLQDNAVGILTQLVNVLCQTDSTHPVHRLVHLALLEHIVVHLEFVHSRAVDGYTALAHTRCLALDNILSPQQQIVLR